MNLVTSFSASASFGKCEALGENAGLIRCKTIVDVNHDFLDRVFNFLEIRDLVSVAEANTHLKVAAEMAFARKFKERLISVYDVNNLPTFSALKIYDDAIRVHESLLAVKVIQLFGQSISRIELFLKKDSLCARFFVHVNEYRHNTLNSLDVFEVNSNILFWMSLRLLILTSNFFKKIFIIIYSCIID